MIRALVILAAASTGSGCVVVNLPPQPRPAPPVAAPAANSNPCAVVNCYGRQVSRIA